MAEPIDSIEAKIVSYLQGVVGLASALDHEPMNLPRVLPVATLLLIRDEGAIVETGGGEDVSYEWRLSIYIALDNWDDAQKKQKDLLPRVRAAIRAHPTADNVCNMLRVEDRGDEPVFSPADGYMRKSLYVTAETTET